MKFGHLFEFHKIPEWYTEYVQYKDLRNMIDEFKRDCKDGLVRQLNGWYIITPKRFFFESSFLLFY